jgi:hypothetical protein
MKTIYAIFLLSAVVTIATVEVFSSRADGEFSHDAYAQVLEQYVNDDGRVDYAGLKDNRELLDAYVFALYSLDRNLFEEWSEDEKLTFWINSYNALTLLLIIDRYPIESSFFRSIVFPKNSIRQISGAWDGIMFPVMGSEMTLDDIEHEVIRKQFDEPRIHMALVCAAISCPTLRNEPYYAERLDEQLDDQSRGFLGDEAKFHIDSDKGVVYLSSIFDWYGGDFAGAYGTSGKGPALREKYGDEKGAVLNFANSYLSEEDQQYLAGETYKVKYLDYDWTLNDQAVEE